MNDHIFIDVALVQLLISKQFPQWNDLAITPVKVSGWDNRTFHLGDKMLVRMPSAKDYELQVEKEQKWLPLLAPLLPLSIPKPLEMGVPDEGYPWKWSIYNWIEGKTLAAANLSNLTEVARSLGEFLSVFHKIDSAGGPQPGLHSFYRGGDLKVYDNQTQQAIKSLKGTINTSLASEVWHTALSSQWQNTPVWVHGDISIGNLLVQNGRLSAVIDFGQLSVGDPACDLAIAWTYFDDESSKVFRETLPLDQDTWCRGRAWTLWKALIVAAGIVETNAAEANKSLQIIDRIIHDHKNQN